MQFVQVPGCNLLDALGVEEDNCCGSFQLQALGSLEGGACFTGEKNSIGCGLEAWGFVFASIPQASFSIFSW
jgi:hypothetical protein